ncbi:MAG: hypothetical protein IT582_00220, partial [Opitutaceae bacterium]|nr:hypothetical protein [Opitutaceae bacterium]
MAGLINRSGIFVRLVFVATALGLIWGVWRPCYFSLNEIMRRPGSADELKTLRTGEYFLIEGTVKPTGGDLREWQGRFVYVHRMFKDVGTHTKDRRVVELEKWRPAVAFIWRDGTLMLSANSYELNHAPRIQPRFWPRKWLWTTRVDDWHESSRGFMAGEAALAYGKMNAEGPRIEMLMQSPLREVV